MLRWLPRFATRTRPSHRAVLFIALKISSARSCGLYPHTVPSRRPVTAVAKHRASESKEILEQS